MKENSETRMSPFALLYGKEAITKISDHVGEYDTKRRMDNLAQLNIQRSYIVEKMKLKAEKNNSVAFRSFPIGTKVLLFDNASYNTGSKLETNWNGPFIVIGNGCKSSWIAHNHNTKPSIVSNERLKEYFPVESEGVLRE